MAKKKQDQEIMTIAEIEAISAEQPKFGKGITVASGFDLGAKSALDTRSTVKTTAERDAHVTGNRAYEGMLVYVEANKKTYQYVNNQWQIFGFDTDLFKATIVDNLESSSTTTVLSANQGRVLKEKITTVDGKVTNVTNRLDSLTLPWNKVTSKPFESMGSTLKNESGALNVKIDNATIVTKADGSLEVRDNLFALSGHTHDTRYASKAHENNQTIHLTADEKTNVGQLPTIQSDIATLKSTVGAASKHHIVMTVEEMNALQNTNHGDICHVISTKKTYILDKLDTDKDSVQVEWIELADFNSLVTVDWSIINSKPFATVGEGLHVDSDAVKVKTDNSTVEIRNGQVAVKNNVFAPFQHTHEVTWQAITNKPTIFSKECSANSWIEEDGLVYLTIPHMKNSTNLVVKVVGTDKIERLVAVEHVNANSIKIWSDEKEDVTVTVFSYDFSIDNPSVHSAIVGLARAGQTVCGVR